MHYRTFFTIALLGLVSLTGCGNSLELTIASYPTASTNDTSTQIVFSRRMEGMNSDLFVMDSEGKNLRQITDTPLREIYPKWSPHGTHLAVGAIPSETSGGGFHIMSMRADGSERVDYTHSNATIMGQLPTWTPDGAITYIGEPDLRIWSLDPATAAVQPLTPQRPEGWTRPYPAPPVPTDDQGTPDWSKIPTQYQGAFDWSPDGSSFVTSLFGNIAQVRADGMSMRWLTEPGGERDRYGFPQPGGDSDPVWSPDGTQIAFVREDARPSAEDLASWRRDIFVMNADGSNVRQLTTTRGFDPSPAWSPDGKRIVFASEGVPQPNKKAQPINDIFVINIDGSGLTNLTNSPEHEMTPDWKR
ncbi:MAG TPA: hypothetical protein VGD58_21340 [Herpetosiphonaceae bacterium]